MIDKPVILIGGGGTAAGRIKNVLKSVDLDGILLKRFHDLPMATLADPAP